MTEFSWPPSGEDHPTAIDHYKAMRKEIEPYVTKQCSEHKLIAERCGVKLHRVCDWRRRRGLKPLIEHPSHGRNYTSNRTVGPAIGGKYDMHKGCKSEAEITEIYDNRMYNDEHLYPR